MSGEVTITLTKTLPDSSAKADFHELVSTATASVDAGAITNTQISASASIVDTKLATISTAGKVSGSALTSLSSVPSGAGTLPNVNMGIGEICFNIGTVEKYMESGIKGDIRFPYAVTITGVYLLANTSGSLVIDLWKDSYANFPPTVADTICASAKPTLSSATKYTDTTLSGWTTSVASGDIIRVNVDSVSVIGQCLLVLTFTRA